eukprot:GHVR01132504.1.p1 GENE.GHVR01132504.1~~GHVR01132504.1.p1  ORF type:complete len:522 (+),score=77.31 GHVR01132504.1:66-1568(+)
MLTRKVTSLLFHIGVVNSINSIEEIKSINNIENISSINSTGDVTGVFTSSAGGENVYEALELQLEDITLTSVPSREFNLWYNTFKVKFTQQESEIERQKIERQCVLYNTFNGVILESEPGGLLEDYLIDNGCQIAGQNELLKIINVGFNESATWKYHICTHKNLNMYIITFEKTLSDTPVVTNFQPLDDKTVNINCIIGTALGEGLFLYDKVIKYSSEFRAGTGDTVVKVKISTDTSGYFDNKKKMPNKLQVKNTMELLEKASVTSKKKKKEATFVVSFNLETETTFVKKKNFELLLSHNISDCMCVRNENLEILMFSIMKGCMPPNEYMGDENMELFIEEFNKYYGKEGNHTATMVETFLSVCTLHEIEKVTSVFALNKTIKFSTPIINNSRYNGDGSPWNITFLRESSKEDIVIGTGILENRLFNKRKVEESYYDNNILYTGDILYFGIEKQQIAGGTLFHKNTYYITTIILRPIIVVSKEFVKSPLQHTKEQLEMIQ